MRASLHTSALVLIRMFPHAGGAAQGNDNIFSIW